MVARMAGEGQDPDSSHQKVLLGMPEAAEASLYSQSLEENLCLCSDQGIQTHTFRLQWYFAGLG